MRQIDRKAKEAFCAWEEFKLSNTEVRLLNGKPHMYLHGNCIAKRDENGDLLISHCGWETNTTRSRLNALPGVRISSYKGSFVLNDIAIMHNGWMNVKYYTSKFYL
jgi:hypothetical protein